MLFELHLVMPETCLSLLGNGLAQGSGGFALCLQKLSSQSEALDAASCQRRAAGDRHSRASWAFLSASALLSSAPLPSGSVVLVTLASTSFASSKLDGCTLTSSFDFLVLLLIFFALLVIFLLSLVIVFILIRPILFDFLLLDLLSFGNSQLDAEGLHVVLIVVKPALWKLWRRTWHVVQKAYGPWRIRPELLVNVPQSCKVTLHLGSNLLSEVTQCKHSMIELSLDRMHGFL
mmetsp:Transcript_31925/g.59649  ORF Transcript_31925/g.59649 Transcript_31925/m.59649 type:complete len:233 (+) Transcript_31925:1542-2240(+)